MLTLFLALQSDVPYVDTYVPLNVDAFFSFTKRCSICWHFF